MPTVMGPAASVLTVACMLLVVVLPGLAVGLAAGLRGWVLAGCAPLLSYGVAGLSGPWLDGLGIPYDPWSLALATGLFAVLGFGLR